jgi:hypothetical protein
MNGLTRVADKEFRGKKSVCWHGSLTYLFTSKALVNSDLSSDIKLFARLNAITGIHRIPTIFHLWDIYLEPGSLVNYYWFHEGRSHHVRSSVAKGKDPYISSIDSLYMGCSLFPYSEEKVGVSWSDARKYMNKVLKR